MPVSSLDANRNWIVLDLLLSKFMYEEPPCQLRPSLKDGLLGGGGGEDWKKSANFLGQTNL